MKVKKNEVFVPVAEGGPDIGTGEPGTVLTSGEGGEYVWTEPSSKFRGAWAPDTILAAYDFNAGLVSPWSTSVEGPGGMEPTIASDSLPAGGIHLKAVQLKTDNSSLASKSRLSLDISSLQNLTRVKFWRRFDPASGFDWSPRFSVEFDGDLQPGSAYTTNTDWAQVEMALPPNTDVISFVHRVVTTAAAKITSSRVTGVEIYGTSTPYMLGEFVTHDGKMWESLANNNAQTPGTGAAWKEALTLPRASGTTAQRPSAVTAGVGYPYFDSTLSLPIWSDGQTWVDATGTDV